MPSADVTMALICGGKSFAARGQTEGDHRHFSNGQRPEDAAADLDSQSFGNATDNMGKTGIDLSINRTFTLTT